MSPRWVWRIIWFRGSDRVGYVEQLDRLLSAGCGVFPTGEPVGGPDVIAAFSEVSPPPGDSGLGGAAGGRLGRYRDASVRIGELVEAIVAGVNAAAAEAREAAAKAVSIRDSARVQAGAVRRRLAPRMGLVRWCAMMDERLAAMQQHVASTREWMRVAAEQIRQRAVELSVVLADRG